MVFCVLTVIIEQLNEAKADIFVVFLCPNSYYDEATEESGTEVERLPLVPKVPGSNSLMSGFCLWESFHTNRASTG